MVYDPSIATVKDRILADLLATLETIAPPDYASEVGPNLNRVRLWSGSAMEFNATPAIAVVAQQDELDDSAWPLQERTLRVALALFVSGTHPTIGGVPEQLERLATEVVLAITRDPQRGDDGSPELRKNARTTRVIGQQTFDPTNNGNSGEGLVELLIEYAHDYDDPAISR